MFATRIKTIQSAPNNQDRQIPRKDNARIIPHAPIPKHITNTDALIAYLKWDRVALMSIQGYPMPFGYPCFTDKFFHELKIYWNINLKTFLAPCSTTLQLGACTGKFLSRMPYIVRTPKGQSHVTIGYDYSVRAIEYMQAKGIIKTRQINLNAVTKIGADTQLAYLDQLKEDLSSKTNILAIRIFEYLDSETVPLLMCALMDFAQPGSTFIFIGRELKDTGAGNSKSELNNDEPVPITCMSRFFQRPDMQIKASVTFAQFRNGRPDTELLVAQKIDPSKESPIARTPCRL